MSNLEVEPRETEVTCDAVEAGASPVQIIAPREVPLGGPRAMTVHRTLPSRARTLIGAWCFVDHYGPSDVSVTGGMVVPPHPHTGLQTVSWLFEGEIEHRDSVGSHAFVRPGELNLMTAGHGISHSEVSTEATSTLHGVQLWVALPEGSREVDPFFENRAAEWTDVGDARAGVFLGELAGSRVDATTFTPLVAAEIVLPAGGRCELPLDPSFEYGVLVDAGPAFVAGTEVARTELAYMGLGRDAVSLEAGADAGAGGVRLLLIGGAPLDEHILMWWNFVGRSHDEIVAYRAAWQHEAGLAPAPADRTAPDAAHPEPARFGATDHHFAGSPLPAPELPTVRLKPRT
ncbi:pirin family protein [Herbiconiux liukaitaii]|uniref:pirin family protein n=1 Tax=Herbiconiux liukaitaii TaxID=3342799 RepID=UPI0035B6E251